ncbi:MAG: ABC transporter permease subunit [Acutalibacteraceae bacterium]
MTLYIKELRQSLKSLCIWTVSVASMILICILMFPEMKSEMDSVSNMFANMGGFTAAFGMDKLSFGELMGFYGIECGNILGIGGGFFAALTGISVLAKEEKDHTAEFLFTHPISRASAITQKLLSVFTQILLMNIAVTETGLISAAVIGEKFPMKEFLLLHIAYLIMQLEIASICFGISAFIRRGNLGIGLGLALLLYFMNLIANISDKADFLRYFTPYAYSEASNIISEARLDMRLILIGAVLSVIGIAAGYWKYMKKDLAA